MKPRTAACGTVIVAVLYSGLDTGGRVGAQGPPISETKFEVASIRRSDPTETNSGFAIRPGGRFVATNVTARALIAAAYHLERTRVTGGPGWVDTDRFVIEAIAFENATRELLEPLLQNLLAERFKLQRHTEKRELGVLILKRASDRQSALRPSSLDCSPAGARLRAQAGGQAATGPVCSIANSSTRISGGGVTMAALAEALSLRTGRPVVDQTALSGLYDFDLKYAPDVGAAVDAVAADGNAGLVTALREQLGLALESGSALLDVLVIESIRQPDEN